MIIKCENSTGVYQDDIGILVESCHGDCSCITEVETEDLLKKEVIIISSTCPYTPLFMVL